MKKQSKRLTVPEINKIVKVAGMKHNWDIWSNYNDKHKDGTRRLKYMRNGHRLTLLRKGQILAKIKKQLRGCKTVQSIGWKVGMKWGYGNYDYIAINLNK